MGLLVPLVSERGSFVGLYILYFGLALVLVVVSPPEEYWHDMCGLLDALDGFC